MEELSTECSVCGKITLHTPVTVQTEHDQDGREFQRVQCSVCHAHNKIYTADEGGQDVASPFINVDRAHLIHPPKTIAAFIGSITAGAPQNAERRAEPRYLISIRTKAQPLDEHFRPVGGLLEVVTKDISDSGIGFHAEHPISTKYLALQLTQPTGERMQMAVEVVRQQILDHNFEIGGTFVTAET